MKTTAFILLLLNVPIEEQGRMLKSHSQARFETKEACEAAGRAADEAAGACSWQSGGRGWFGRCITWSCHPVE